MNTQQQVVTQITLANAVEIVAGVITKVSGEEISNHLNGEALYGSVLNEVVAVKLQSVLTPHLSF